jgi:hypothetical protein
MFSIESRDFLNNLLSFGFNTVKQIFICFCMFLTFRDLPYVKRTKYFCHVIFSGNRGKWEEEFNGERHEAQKRGHHAGPHVGRMVGPIFVLVSPIATNFGSTDSF